MPLDTTTRVPIDQRQLAHTRQSLHEFFGVDFDLWFYEDAWWKIPADESHDLELAGELVHAVLETVRPNPGHALSIPMAGSTDTLLVVPLPKQNRRWMAATANFRQSQTEFVERLARLFIKDLAKQEELTQLRHEHEAFLRQVTNDFEELTFLRSMASLLEISDLTFDFEAMGESMLPTLKPLIESDALVLVSATDPSDSSDGKSSAVRGPCVWSGTRCVADDVCVRLVQHYRDAAVRQPVVKNNFAGTSEGADFPGVTSFILVPIVSGESTTGWLLALNRNNERNINAEELPWELSYLEFGSHEATLMSSSAAILATHGRNVQLFREREEMMVSVVRSLISAIEAKDEYTRGHSERVALYGKQIGMQMGLDDDHCQKLYLSGLLHDIGKIGVRDAILSKPGPLSEEEFEEIKQHPDKGWQILHDLNPLRYVLNGILFHHEQFDGRGYPDRLVGTQIPIEGRILAVADAYDAMTSDRPYRVGMPHEKAESILKMGAGKQWDPEVLDAFFRCTPTILQIKAVFQPRLSPQRKGSPSAL